MDEIPVKVNSYGPGRPLSLVYFDPTSGKKKAKSSGTTDWREAERLAGELEKSLAQGAPSVPSRLTWADFRQRYEQEKLASLARGTGNQAHGAFAHLERILNPDRVVKLTASALSRFQAELRREGMKEASIAKVLRHVKAALRWGAAMGLIPPAPRIEMPKRAKGQRLMKGRPITGEEFDRMLAAVFKVRPNDPEPRSRLLTGLWLSGLRLGEALRLSWDWQAGFSVDVTGKYPVFRIRRDSQKSGQDEVAPMTPDFAEWLLQTSEAERVGRVFPLPSLKAPGMAPHNVSRTVAEIGRKAGVVTDAASGACASAHDLRRGFGTRWAKRAMPAVLKRLMRHADISTTMGYYVDLDAGDVSAELWAGYGNETGNIGAFGAEGETRKALVDKHLGP